MSFSRLLTSVLILALGSVAAADGPGQHRPAPQAGSADARFEFLKGLEGTWWAEAGEGEAAARWEFRVTAGGSAVEEREFAGTAQEMVTFYYMDGGELRATHYCMLGNRPEAVAGRGGPASALEFGCAGTPGGAASHDEQHVHGWKMSLDGDGRLHLEARIVQNGETDHAPSFVLTRGDG